MSEGLGPRVDGGDMNGAGDVGASIGGGDESPQPIHFQQLNQLNIFESDVAGGLAALHSIDPSYSDRVLAMMERDLEADHLDREAERVDLRECRAIERRAPWFGLASLVVVALIVWLPLHYGQPWIAAALGALFGGAGLVGVVRLFAMPRLGGRAPSEEQRPDR